MQITRARLVAPERIELSQVELQPQPNHLLIKTLANGICHSEKATWLAGPSGDQFIGLGHEPVGEIVEVGRDVEGDWAVGQRVAGYWGPGCSTYAAVDPNRVALVPDGLPTHHAIGEVLACLVTCARGWNHEIGADLALVGCGFMGVVSVSTVRHTARNLIAVDLNPERLAFAQRHGATALVRADEDPIAQVRELTDGRMCQVVGEASGTGAGLELATRLTGGFRPVLNAISWYNRELRLSNLSALANGCVVRNPHPAYAPDRMEELRLGLEFAAKGAWNLDDAITHTWPLEQCCEAYETAMGGRDGYLKGVVVME